MNCKSLLRILTPLLFLTGIIFTSGMKSAPLPPVSEDDTRIDSKTFFVKRSFAEVYGLNSTGFALVSHAADSIAWRGLSSDDFGVEAYTPDFFNNNHAWAPVDSWRYGTLSLLPKQQYSDEFSVGVSNEKIATNPVPEPATIILLSCGLMGVAVLGKRRLSLHSD